MAISGYATTENNPNYLGVLFEIGQNATPFLNAVGGINGARAVSSVNFALNTNYQLATASQPAISEDAAVSGVTPTTFDQNQDENSVQIFDRIAQVSYANSSDISTLAGVPAWQGENQVTDKMGAQVTRNLRQMAVDLEYTMFNGVYTKWTASGTAAGTRGISTAMTTNVVDGTAGLDKAMFNTLTRTMADNGAELDNGMTAIMVNSKYKQALSELFVLQERSFDMGGVTADSIATDFGILPVIYAPKVAQSEILIVDVSKCSLAVLPTADGQALKVEPLAKNGASDRTQLYLQAGMDYGHEIFHGKINNLA